MVVRVPPGFLADRLVVILVLAALAGAVWLDVGRAVAQYSLVWLACLVFAVGVTLEAAHLWAALRELRLVALAVLLPWAVLVPCGVLLVRLFPGPASYGLLTVASAPTEVSAVLLTAIVLGNAALTTSAVCLSLLLAPLVIPAALQLAGTPTLIGPEDLMVELALGVAAPLVVALGLRSLSRGALRSVLEGYGPDLGSLALALLLVGAGAAARTALVGTAVAVQDYAIGALGIVVALGLPFGLGAAIGHVLRLAGPLRAAVTFSVGMREFGVATAVAQLAVPTGVAVPATYGILLMVVASALARWLQGRRGARVPIST
jgi:predicted Na+-dependent transporter